MSCLISFIFVLSIGTLQVCCKKNDDFYPCSWVNKVFTIYNGKVKVGTWSFSITGQDSTLQIFGQVIQLEYEEIEGQFMFQREITNPDLVMCMSIYNRTENLFHFHYSGELVKDPPDKCAVCRDFDDDMYTARVDNDQKNSTGGPVEEYYSSCRYPHGCRHSSLFEMCDTKREMKIDLGQCDRSPPPMPKMQNMHHM